nr:MAG TPA: hypothetical protein [Caudoviricetes sp.]
MILVNSYLKNLSGKELSCLLSFLPAAFSGSRLIDLMAYTWLIHGFFVSYALLIVTVVYCNWSLPVVHHFIVSDSDTFLFGLFALL